MLILSMEVTRKARKQPAEEGCIWVVNLLFFLGGGEQVGHRKKCGLNFQTLLLMTVLSLVNYLAMNDMRGDIPF